METPLTAKIRPDGTMVDLAAYERAGGYEAARKAMRMSPAEITEEVKKSNLRGRGGAGFPTGQKWSFVPLGPDAPRPKYLVANGDEMEPGTFKDRVLLEGDPHGLLEGMIVAARAIEADRGYIFLRGEYTDAAERLERALQEAGAKGYLGKNIFGSGSDFDLRLHLSGGRYMCGEETGLLNALEGKRANPRAKPPFPQVSGLFGKPTIVQNIETLSNVPHIIAKGAEWFKGLALTPDAGTKLYGASGKVKKPGCWELPMGTPMRELLDVYAGGMREGVKFRGVLPGGASTDFLTVDHLDVPMDFTQVAKAGSRLGTGTMIVLDDKTCPVGMVHNLTHFFSQESCGWCTPCWSGLRWAEEMLWAIEEGRGSASDLDRLGYICGMMAPGNTFCALAPGAAEPIQSALKFFRDDFERHLRYKHCPWRDGR
ncbi:MAG TPA: NADH-quinone oxidoreductase subunit NuoF [Candidatus Acidoferrales bacterium]|nr:NADH-quinone oxidoreductase subunit NuoF [Candidatus Acidoferrales bacterium]